jgi:hypothetical protein
MLLARGQASDRRRALGLLDRAAATVGTLGMAALAEEIQALQAAQAAKTLQVEPAADTAGSAGPGTVFRPEGEYWTVCYEGSIVRLKDAKGLRQLARLLTHPGREFHAADLEGADRQAAPVGLRERAEAGELEVRPDLGDAGGLLDATAKAAYRPGWTSCGSSWRRPRASTTRPGPPGPEPSETSLSVNWRGRWGWAARTAGRRPTPSGPG